MLTGFLFLLLAFSSPLLGTSLSGINFEKIANLKDLTDLALATASKPYSQEDQNLYFFIRAQHIVGGGYYPLCPWRTMTTSGLYSASVFENLKGFSVSKLEPGAEEGKHDFSFEISIQADSKLKAKISFELALSLLYGSHSLDDTIKELLLGVFVDKTPAGNFEITMQFLGDADAELILQLLDDWWPMKNSRLMLKKRAGVNLSSALMNMQNVYPEAIDRDDCRHTWSLYIGDLMINELPSITILFDFICSFSSRNLYPGLRLWRDGYSEETSQRISIHLPSGNLDELSGTLTIFIRALISRLLEAYIGESTTFLMLNLVGAQFNGSSSLDLYFHPVVHLGRAVEALQFINYPAASLSLQSEYPDLEAINAVSVLVEGVEHPIATGGDLFNVLEQLTELPKTPIRISFSGEKEMKPFQLRISLDNTAVGVCRNIIYHIMFSLYYVERKYGKLASKTVEINPAGKSAMLVISAYGQKNQVYEVFQPLRRLIYILLAHMNVSNGSNIMIGRLGARDNFTIDKTMKWDDVTGVRAQRLIYDIYPKGPLNQIERKASVPKIEEKCEASGSGKKKGPGKQKTKSPAAQTNRPQPQATRAPSPRPASLESQSAEEPEVESPVKVPVNSPWASSPWARTETIFNVETQVKKEEPKTEPVTETAPKKKMTRHQKLLAKGLSKRNKTVNVQRLVEEQKEEKKEVVEDKMSAIEATPTSTNTCTKLATKKAEDIPKHQILAPFFANGVSWKVFLPFGSIDDKFDSSESDVIKYFEELFAKIPTDLFEKYHFSVVRNRLRRGNLVELITVPIEKQDRMFEFVDIFVKTSMKNIEIEKFAIHDSFVVLYVNGSMTYNVRSRLAHQVRKMFRLPHNEFERLRDLTENKPRKHPQVAMSNALIPSKQLKASPPFVYCGKTWDFVYNVDNSWDVFKYKIFLKDTLPDHPYKYVNTFVAALPGNYFANGHGFEVQLADYNPLPRIFVSSVAGDDVEKAKKLLRPHQIIRVHPSFSTKSEVYQTFIRLFAVCAENNLPVFKFKVGDLANPIDAFIEIHLCQDARPLQAGRIRSAIRALGLNFE